MGLPLLDGNGVAAHLRSTYGDTVLIVTMTADGRASEKAKRIGAVGCLSKPFELDDLLTIVRETLSNR
jgi:DNA-binding response OmpR family regulator